MSERSGRFTTGGNPLMQGINTSPPLGRIDVAGSTGDTIPTIRVRGANQTGALVDIDSAGFPTNETPFFRVYRNASRLIEVLGNNQINMGPMAINGNLEWTTNAGRFISYNQGSNTIPPINVYTTSSHTGLGYRLQSGVTSDFNTFNPNGTFQWGIKSDNGGVHSRFATTANSGNAARGTVALTAGTVTVTNTYVATGDRVIISLITGGGTLSVQYAATTINSGASFIIDGLNADRTRNTSDTSTVYWEIIRPA